jgi:hypothetical protein
VSDAVEQAEARAKENALKDKEVVAARAALEKAAGRKFTTTELHTETERPLTSAELYHETGNIHPEPVNA